MKFIDFESNNIREDIIELFDSLIEQGLPQTFEIRNWGKDDKKSDIWFDVYDDYHDFGFRFESDPNAHKAKDYHKRHQITLY